MASDAVRALVITGFGLNCEAETEHALTLAGAAVDRVHLNDLADRDEPLAPYRIVAFIGGFSFGDHLGAGAVLANRLRCRLWEPLRAFVDGGGLAIGICNGFQTMVRLGLLPHLPDDPFARRLGLAHNDRGVFHDGWVTVAVDPDTPCVFLRGIERLELPVRHGEGKLVFADASLRERMAAEHLVALRYVDPATGAPTDAFPHNPNGSELAAAAVCDPSGRIFGLMPHPEAYLHPWNHPQWTRRQLDGPLPEHGAGLAIFRNAIAAARGELS